MHNKNTGRKATNLKRLALTSTALAGWSRPVTSVLALALAGGLAMPLPAFADDWLGTSSNDWSTAGNWSAGVPGAGTDVNIDTVTPNPTVLNGGAATVGTVTVGTSASGSLVVSGGGTLDGVAGIVGDGVNSNGTVTVDGAGSKWTNSSELDVGNRGTGTLDITNGGAVSNFRTILGSNTGSNATVTVDGVGSTWTNGDLLYVGANGAASLTISNGGKVQNTLAMVGAGNGTGTVDVSGVGSTWTNNGDLTVGGAVSGTLKIAGGGAVSSTNGILGDTAGSTGTATIDGTGSTWTNSADLTIGNFGTGTLDITNGGAVTNVGGIVGDQLGSTGTVTVNGAGSSWTNTGDLAVGYSGNGTLVIANGGTVHNNVGGLAVSDPGSIGHVTVDGAGSSWVSDDDTLVGVIGKGRLDITNGGQVTTGATVPGAKAVIGSAAGSQGLVFVEHAGSTWNVVNNLVVGSGGFGSLVIDGGGKVSVGGTLILAENAGSQGDLNIGGGVAPGTLDAANVQFGAGFGRIIFNHTGTNYNFDSAISGFGMILQAGGVTHLTADSSGFTGPTHINGGTLLVDGKLGTGPVDVQAGGTLGGKGSIGGTVAIASGGTLSGIQGQTLTMQNLGLASGANVDVTLNTPGGAALFHVVNDLTLDGSLNIATNGVFGPGVYSLMTYGGTLTDNGLDIGSTPPGSTAADFAVQTSIAGQVNLVSAALPNLGFWDGDGAGAANNNAVDGGSGVWTAASSNWTDANGATNGVLHPQPSFTIFQGAAGTVTADASAGAISVTGMQFASDGYQITGAPIALANPNSIIRVGDGSAAGANYKATIASVLSGAGGLEKTDLGTLILTADNTYTGGTAITGGTLQLGNGGAGGSVTGDIDNNGKLVFDRSDISTFAGAISGSGLIEQNGTGTLNLTGNSGSFTGGALVNAGTLGVKSGGVLNTSHLFAAIDIGSTAAVAVDGAGSLLNSTGDLAIGGSGAATLTITNGGTASDAMGVLGANAGSSGTATVAGAGSAWINSTDLLVGADGIGKLNILNGGVVSDASANVGNGTPSQGSVVVDGAGSTWINTGDVSVGLGGSGTVTIANGGLVSVGGTATIAKHAGSTGTLNIGAAAGSVATGAGTFNAANLAFGAGTGTLNFNHTDANYTFASAMTGTGTIDQLAGSTNLTGNSSGFAGAVNVKGGRLLVNGLLGNGQVTVDSGATLGGNGSIGSLTANAGSIIAPGNSIGTLNVAGNASFAAGSTYQVELDPAGQSDLINVTGTANIANGALLTVAKTGTGPYIAGTRYTVLTAAGGLTGTYTLGNVQLSNFLDLVGGADASNYYLDIIKTKTLASAAATPNQIATGTAIDGLPISSTLTGAVASLSSDAAAQYALDQLSGEIHASAKTVMIEDSRFLRSAVNDRLRAAFGGVGASGGNAVTYDDGKPHAVAADTDGGAVWGQAFGSWGHWNSDGNAARLDRSIGGFFMGADAPVFDNWRFGAVAGYSGTSFNAGDRHSSGTSDNYSVGLYGGTTWGDLAFRTGAAYTVHDIATVRHLSFTGFDDSLSGDYRAGTAQVFGELGFKMQAGNVALEPFANLAYVNLRTDGFSEKGGVAALTSESSNTDATFTTLGLRASTGFDLNGMALTAKGTVGWRHDFGDTTPNSVMSFAGSAPFDIAGVPIARDAAVVDLGLDMNLGENSTLGVSYDGQFGSGVTDQTLRANFSVKF